MDFINTTIGNRICELATQALKGVIAEQKRKTVCKTVLRNHVEHTIDEFTKDGAIYVDNVDVGDGWVCLVFKK